MKKLIVLILLGFALLAMDRSATARQAILPGPMAGEVLRVIDGDTVSVRVQVWIGQDIETLVRVAGIDTPELKGKCAAERQKAMTAKQKVMRFLADNKVSLRNITLEKYAGRVKADIHASNGQSLAQYMIAQGVARPYGGEKRQSWCS